MNRFFLKLAVGRLAGNLHALSVRVVQPAMIAAAHAVALNVAETEIGAPVRAKGADDADFSFGIAEQNQVFAEHANESRPLFQMSGNADGPPIAPQELTHRRALARAGQNFVFFFGSFIHWKLPP